MAGYCIGHVTHYYGDLHVAALALTDVLRVGDWLHVAGRTTDFVQQVQVLHKEHLTIEKAGPGEAVTLLVRERVHPLDDVYRVTPGEAAQLAGGLALAGGT